MKTAIQFIFALLVATSLHAQKKNPTIIKAGKLIDTESGKVLLNQLILIENDSIKAVGPNIKIPSNATIIDLSKATVLPGLIDSHTHITSQPSGD